jgi:hypothetical protein
MCWDTAVMREDRQQAYFDSILMAVSEAGGRLTRRKLLAIVTKELPRMGNTAWHVDRMVSAMIRGRCLLLKDGAIVLNSTPGAQQYR